MAMSEQTIERGKVLLVRYDLGVLEDYDESHPDFTADGIFFGDEGLVEHLLHEVSHARLLGLRLGPELSPRISQALVELDPHGGGKGVKACWEEARCWAVEWHCIQALGMAFELGDCLEGALIQGCQRGDVEKYYADPESLKVAKSVLKHMRRT